NRVHTQHQHPKTDEYESAQTEIRLGKIDQEEPSDANCKARESHVPELVLAQHGTQHEHRKCLDHPKQSKKRPVESPEQEHRQAGEEWVVHPEIAARSDALGEGVQRSESARKLRRCWRSARARKARSACARVVARRTPVFG